MGQKLDEQCHLQKRRERDREIEIERGGEGKEGRGRGEERKREKFKWLIFLVMLDLWAVLRVEVDTKRCPKMLFPDFAKIRK